MIQILRVSSGEVCWMDEERRFDIKLSVYELGTNIDIYIYLS